MRRPPRRPRSPTKPGRGRRAPHLDSGWGRGQGNTLCLEIRWRTPQLSTLSGIVSCPQLATGAGAAPGLCSFPPPPDSGWGEKRGLGGLGRMCDLKQHHRGRAREKEKHRLHRLRAAPGPGSAASPALHASSSSHIRGGGGRGAARGAAAGGRGMAPPTPGRRQGRGGGGRAPGGGEGPRGAAPAGSPGPGGGRRAAGTAALTVRSVAPAGPRRAGEDRGREGGARTGTRVFSAEAFLLRSSSRGRQSRAPPTSSPLGVGASKRWG